MTRNPNNSQDRLNDEIRRQVGSQGMARFLNALPSFQVQETLPDSFQLLLTELDRAETMRSRRS